VELGWGGYWAWDPVENASLLPWLTATALVHALMFRGNRVKVSHIALVVTTFALCIFGTFVTRSGMISSVHAFAVSTIGFYFLGFLALVIGGSVAVAYRRRSFLRGGDETEELISRPSALLLTIILLAAGTAAILVGTLFPLISEAVNLSLTADYFNLSSVVIFGPLILLMGICPFVPWREGSLKGVARAVLVPFIVAIVVAAGLFVLGLRDVFGFLAFSVCAFVLVGTLTQFVPGVGGRGDAPAGNRLRWAWSRLARQSRRYGSFLVHLGILLIAVGVIGSTAYRIEQEVTLERGESATVGPYSLTYDDFSYAPAQAKDIAAATITVGQGGSAVGVLRPERQFFYATQQPVSEVAIRSTLREDLYLALIGWGEEGQNVVLEVVVSPLVVWIWIGGAVLLVGGAVALRPSRKKDVVDQRIELAVRNLRGRGVRPVQEA
jgi:cytochrome c-type biogenesis protein CcmF